MAETPSAPTGSQLDIIKEIVNVGVGRAAASLNSLVDSHIELSLPDVKILKPQDLQNTNADLFCCKLSSVHLSFKGLFSGTAMLAFPTDGAVKLVSTLTGENADSSSLDEVMAGTLNEVGNIFINGIIGSISNLLDEPLDFSLPEYGEGKLTDLMNRNYGSDNITAVMAHINFNIESLKVTGNTVLIFELLSFKNFISSIDRALKANELTIT